jgi:cysteinyl-tRNA synthetase
MTSLSLYNTLSSKKEKFVPIKAGSVGIYQCGPTVYDTAHIGNFRTFVLYDILRRVFEYERYEVKQIMNITDVDDKTLRRSREEKTSLPDLTDKYEKLFFEDCKVLNLLTPHQILKARDEDNIKAMKDMVKILLEKGFAYKAADGIYMHVSKVKNYGALAKIKLDAEVKERISNDEYDKENPRDFALWKLFDGSLVGKDNSFPDIDGSKNEIAWAADFGRGRPGWHIECSAMAKRALGETIDIHTGGADLIFPHHTNEIAQSESANDKKFANYWVHGGSMNVNDAKMAKSKSNFVKISDLIDNSIAPISFRYWLLTSHYRTQVNFSFEAVAAAQKALFKLCEDIMNWPAKGEVNEKYRLEFEKTITDDLNMPQAIALLWKIVKDPTISDADKKATAINFDKVFGLRLGELSPVPETPTDKPPEEIIALSAAREAARLAKDWTKADALRKEIEDRGYRVKDTQDGSTVVQ